MPFKLNKSKNGKEKIVAFHKSANNTKFDKFTLERKEVEQVKLYCYLGQIFKSLSENAKDHISQANISTGESPQTIYKANSRSIIAANHIFNSVASATSLYAAEIWSPRY